MSRWYRFLYKVGLTPWEQDSDVVGPQIDQLLGRERRRSVTRATAERWTSDVGLAGGR